LIEAIAFFSDEAGDAIALPVVRVRRYFIFHKLSIEIQSCFLQWLKINTHPVVKN